MNTVWLNYPCSGETWNNLHVPEEIINNPNDPPIFNTVVGVTTSQLSPNFELKENYPNPFNFETTIQYQILKEAEVKLEIYNTLGQKIITLVNEKLPPGTHVSQWNGKDFNEGYVSDGVYLIWLQVDDFVRTKELLLSH